MNEAYVMDRAATLIVARGRFACWGLCLAWLWFDSDIYARVLCYRVDMSQPAGHPLIGMSFGNASLGTQRMTQRRRFPALLILPVVVVSTLGSRALAQPSPKPETSEPPAPQQETSEPPAPSVEPETRPWATGVPEEAQRRAQQLFAEGNEFLDNLGFATAAGKFRQAIESWAHPAIQYNLAIALIKLDQPIEAYQTINQALRYGAAPLDAEQYQQALNYQQLLRNQIGEVELNCAQDGVEVKLDGKLVLTGSKTARTSLLVGEHQLVASKQGHRTVTRSLLVSSNATTKVHLRLFTEEELTGSKRYWKSWQPWVVVAAGTGIILAGGALHYWGARANIKAFDDQLARDCPVGCHDSEAASPSALLRTGELQQKLAWTGYVAGGLVAAVGIAGVVINLPRQVPLDRRSEETRITVGLSPLSSGGGLRIAGQF